VGVPQNYPNLTSLVLKPMVTWGSPIFRKPPNTRINVFIKNSSRESRTKVIHDVPASNVWVSQRHDQCHSFQTFVPHQQGTLDACQALRTHTFGKVSSLTSCLPAGKHTKNYGKIHHFQWVNQLFLWPCSIAVCVFTRGYPILENPCPFDVSYCRSVCRDSCALTKMRSKFPKMKDLTTKCGFKYHKWRIQIIEIGN